MKHKDQNKMYWKISKERYNQIFRKDDMIHPLTIVSDRHNGSYSGAKFLAFNLYYDRIPLSVNSDIEDEKRFWGREHHRGKAKKYIIGKGDTPNEAYDNLKKLLKNEEK